MNAPLKSALVAIPCLGVLFILTDCTAGKAAYYSAVVSGKEYQPAYTTLSTDNDGHVSSITHSEQYHVICAASNGLLFDVDTWRSTYYSVTNGQRVIVSTRVGKWTAINYLARVSPAQVEVGR